jgi:hypothetical protein
LAEQESTNSAEGRSRRARAKWAGLLALGVLLLALIVIAITRESDNGSAEVPAGAIAVVEGVPDGSVNQVDYRRNFARRLAESPRKGTPKAGSGEYEGLQTAAIGELLQRIWLRGEAEEHGISSKEIENKVAEFKRNSWPTQKALRKFLKTFHYTAEELDGKIEARVLADLVNEKLEDEAPPPSEAEIAKYYETEDKSLFRAPKTVDLRMVVNADKGIAERAKRELEKSRTPEDWEKVAAKYSTDSASKDKGGLQSLNEEALPLPLLGMVEFAPTGSLSVPVKSEGNWFVLEVIDKKPEREMTLAEARPLIRVALAKEAGENFVANYRPSFQSKWISRTVCAPTHLNKYCSNYHGDE